MRVKAVISYDGSHYQGFQRQNSTSNTITTAIENALHSLQIQTQIVGSGRTDSGVHATGQVIHFDLPPFWIDLQKLTHRLNQKLIDISFKHISPTEDDFHARFHAKKRVYRYLFKTTKPSVFEQSYVSHYENFDPAMLLKALHLFEGKHDFKFFHKTGSQNHTTIRNIYRTSYRTYRGYHMIYFEANGFLRSQVRMMVDAAMRCAQNTMNIQHLEEQLSCKRQHTTALASGNGLYLSKVIY
ncbi:MAG: hypothetical protein RLZZ428_85 [Pseudomonadota bacterium]